MREWVSEEVSGGGGEVSGGGGGKRKGSCDCSTKTEN